ncbi:hypothetical protein PAXINDRAFT_164450 [Paxillus involutus ATCC 200175]|uniref:Unplaced genomic scaffold PAXINscaffold_263, whole genome shotgun sequence n=1 Tax=Paxillus involutus ATCC 200175 TaxID=664439 RepID=A0A0C9TC76_PAXIN|nr:hypothetical protein PAXINDRAFT_164450 [Paxillus involutus ATCC 200175]
MDVSEEKRWLYTMFIGIDTNFRLWRKHVLNNEVDPGLSKGWAYFIEEKAYKDHLAKHKDETQEHSTCSGHNAVNMADTKKSRGLAATGVGTLANGVGNLQKGEKYINMDYLFLLTMHDCEVLVLKSPMISPVSGTRTSGCAGNLPDVYHMDYKKMTIIFLVLKFHLPAHVTHCQIMFSFNLTQYVGCTDGEAPERGWANINPVASSMKEMGPGTWRDTLGDHFGNWNWKWVQQLVMEAKFMFAEHNQELNNFEACIDQTMLAQWMREVEAWEKDPSQPNPYETRVANTYFVAISQAAVRLELARAEVVEFEARNNNSLHPDLLPIVLISSGLEIEGQYRHSLKVDTVALEQHATDHQLGKIQQYSNMLRWHIDAWQEVQLLYMPFVVRLCANNDSSAEGVAKDSDHTIMNAVHAAISASSTKLWLPSDIGSQDRCDKLLCEHEWDLHYAQAEEALNDIQHFLHLRTHLYKFKDNNIQDQMENT